MATGPFGKVAKPGIYKIIRENNGRIVEISGSLALKAERNATTAVKKIYELGHLVGKQFKGTEVVPMLKNLNHGAYAATERAWAAAARNGHEVRVWITPVWKHKDDQVPIEIWVASFTRYFNR
jgi:hypothetical protein